VGDPGVQAIGAALLVLAGRLLSVLAAIIDRSGPIRLGHWAEEAGGRLRTLYGQPARFELFRALLSWSAGVALLIGVVAIWSLAIARAWTVQSLLLIAALIGLLLFAGEILSRGLVARDPEGALRRFTPLFRVAHLLARPAIVILRPLLPVAAIRRRDEELPDEATSEEIEAFLSVGEREGILEPGEEEMVRGIVDLGETEVRSVMVPRIDMITAPPGEAAHQLADLFLESGHSRLPLYDEDADQVVGVLHLRHLLKGLRSQPVPPIPTLSRPPFLVQETDRLDDLLSEMQKRHEQIAIVLDEYGGTAGLVTVEDLLEEIVGEIRDEYDAPEQQPEELGPGRWQLAGATPLSDMEDLFEMEIVDTSAATVAGLVLERLGRIPVVGAIVDIQDLRLTVERVRHRRIRSVRIERSVVCEAREVGKAGEPPDTGDRE